MRDDIEFKAVPPVPPFAVPTWLRPVISSGAKTVLAGGIAHYDAIDVVQRNNDAYSVCRMDVDAILATSDDRNAASRIIDNLNNPRAPFAGLPMAEPQIMGILNVTPDSFSDGGQFSAPAKAVAGGNALYQAGASIIDIGGESTRPGAAPITRNQELARVLPPLTGLAQSGVLLSIDTQHPEVMHRAISAGAVIINDINALRKEGALSAAAQTGASVVIMHMQGTPETMQESPEYGFAPAEIYEFLEARIKAAIAAGIPLEKISIDPGFGFGKTLSHNLALVNWLSMLHGLGVPVLFGASRKSSIAKMAAGEPADQRVPGSLVLAMAAVRQGAQMLRVHDVSETVQALAVEMALMAGMNTLR
jgi:dihydropteroate synthase